MLNNSYIDIVERPIWSS